MSSSPVPPDDIKKSWEPLGNHSTTPTPPGFVSPSLWSGSNATSTTDTASSTGGAPPRHNERTSSFTNIAAALGNDLAENIDDATRGDFLSKSHHAGEDVNLTDTFLNPSKKTEVAYERHKRHAASRLLGAGVAPPSSSSHTGAEAGSLFGGLDSTEAHNNDNHSRNESGGRRPVGLESSTVPSPFSHDPTVAAFRPSYETTPIGSSLQFPSNQGNNGRDERSDTGKSHIGTTVMEPDSSYGGGGGANIPTNNFSQYGKTEDLTYGMQKMKIWSSEPSGGRGRGGDSRGFNPASPSPKRDGLGLGSPSGPIDAEDDLRPFTWDTNHHEQSRTLAVLNASSIPQNEIIRLCDNFGVTETFRAEFLEKLGVVFISFFDMRCAQFASLQLPRMLNNLVVGNARVQVKFCVPLNSSSQNDESMVVINDLPHQIGNDNLSRILSSFGAIRSMKNLGAGNYGSSFVAEFHDIQDAQKVVSELESNQPWGPDVSVEVGGRSPSDRKKGRELNAMLSRWRNQGGAQGRPMDRGRQAGNKTPESYRPYVDSRGMSPRDGRYDRGYSHEDQNPHHGYGPGRQDGRYGYGGNTYVVHQPHSGYGQYRGPHHPADNVHGNHHGTYINHQGSHQPPPHQQHYYQQSQPMGHGNFPDSNSVISRGSSRHTGTSGYYTPDDRSIGSHNSNLRSIGSLDASLANTRDGQQHLVLDLDAVENGLDTRTSLMVRNIPNKYTQQMLLTEFKENNHGPGIIDFFYLPIDFKNRCNRGYAFINFVDYHDILKFHRQYYGQHWRTFNSDKICDITYARIQGKAAMLKRFENSALMEKDEEYKPLVFVSSGPERGRRLPFPDSSSRGS